MRRRRYGQKSLRRTYLQMPKEVLRWWPEVTKVNNKVQEKSLTKVKLFFCAFFQRLHPQSTLGFKLECPTQIPTQPYPSPIHFESFPMRSPRRFPLTLALRVYNFPWHKDIYDFPWLSPEHSSLEKLRFILTSIYFSEQADFPWLIYFHPTYDFSRHTTPKMQYFQQWERERQQRKGKETWKQFLTIPP